MIYNYKEVFSELLTDESKKKVKFKAFEGKDFKDYKKEAEKEGRNISVVANSRLKLVKKEDLKDNEDYLCIGEFYFLLKDEKSHSAKYYIPVESDRFIRVEKSFLIIILLLLGAGLLVGGLLLFSKPKEPEVIIDPSKDQPELEFEDETHNWEGEQYITNNSTEYQESTIIPGYADIRANSQQRYVQLYNVADNTVNFVYTAMIERSNEVVDIFADVDTAQKFVSANKPDYVNYKTEDGRYCVKNNKTGDITDEYVEYVSTKNNDGTYTVTKYLYKVIYFTKGIAPGQAVDWDVYESLGGPGTYKVRLSIAPFDVTSGARCYGANQEVEIVIN